MIYSIIDVEAVERTRYDMSFKYFLITKDAHMFICPGEHLVIRKARRREKE